MRRASVRDAGHAGRARAVRVAPAAAAARRRRRAARHADRPLRARESALAARDRRRIDRDLPRAARLRVAVVVRASPTRMVPTWNYATVHVHGTLELVADAADARARPRRARAALRRRARRRRGSSRMAEPQRERDGRGDRRVPHRASGASTASSSCRRTARRTTARASPTALRRATATPKPPRPRDWMRRYAAAPDPRWRRDAPAQAHACASTSGCGRRASTRRAALAAQAIEAGQVRVGGERVKPAHAVRVGETRRRAQGAASRGTSRCSALSDRRGGAAEAALLYRETRREPGARARSSLRAAARRRAQRPALHGTADEARAAQARGLPQRAVASCAGRFRGAGRPQAPLQPSRRAVPTASTIVSDLDAAIGA